MPLALSCCPQVFADEATDLITVYDFGKQLAQMFGWRPTQYETKKLLGLEPPNTEPGVTFSHFTKMLNQDKPSPVLLKIQTALLELHQLFQCFDTDSEETAPDFVVSVTEFRKVVRACGHLHSNEELDAIFDEVCSLHVDFDVTN